MASKSEAPAVEPEAVEEQSPNEEVVAETADAVEEAPAVEPEAAADDGVDEIAELNARPIAMRHPDGDGSCDRYEQDADGNVLVPASEAALMLEHGFVIVDEEA